MSWTSDALALSSIADNEEMQEQFLEFQSGAVATVGWVTLMTDENGEVFTRDGEIYENVGQLPEWCENDGEIQDAVADALCEELLGFFTEMYDVLCMTVEDNNPDSVDWSQRGHDYILTAGSHGAGFWDRGYSWWVSQELCDAAVGGTGDHSFWFDGEELRYEQC